MKSANQSQFNKMTEDYICYKQFHWSILNLFELEFEIRVSQTGFKAWTWNIFVTYFTDRYKKNNKKIKINQCFSYAWFFHV